VNGLVLQLLELSGLFFKSFGRVLAHKGGRF
jgi:hypothetical protein